ncbi:3-hydroxyacyl-CoA dehydrogenase NAD-binding domain-containing protein [Pseudooceanicola sp.]|uniref:3-hydroxyacyl-CoA dehydrogenase NAD-binding domain-containing protein n=1 Tax=Pseudooceanicola sp. TaxID=1914328 RepID=UPI0040589072
MSPLDKRFATPPAGGGRICVVGAGFMGCVIATLYARHGYAVTLCDEVPALLESYRDRARPIAASFSSDSCEVKAMLARVTPLADLSGATAS